MNRRKRILWLGESSFLNTGYAIYTKEILDRLYKTDKYDIAELGVYGHMTDERRFSIPWRYYGNNPDMPGDEVVYNSNQINQFGMWKFEETCLDFRPDIICDPRDWWMGEYAGRSPFRDKYKWAIMPTIDSTPQCEEWVESYMNADAVFAYSEFGRDYLYDATGNRVKFRELAPPGADYDVLKPVANKVAHRRKMGFTDDVLLVGTVMRNQKRKLYPDLIETFARFLNDYGMIKNGKKVYLYIHCSYPDSGWDIPRLIREAGISHRVLFTYVCSHCGHVFPSFFADAKQVCPRCNSASAGLPNTNTGVTKQQMADILNCFDVYVQYSICEGFGMPQVEAAACGVPVIAVDYSAMSSVVKNLEGAWAVPVQRLFREAESHSYRAYPDNDTLKQLLYNFFSMPEYRRQEMSKKCYLNSRKYYNWDQSAKAWENYFDEAEVDNSVWDAPPRIHQPALNPPGMELTNEQFVRWAIANVWGRPDKTDSYIALRMIRDLNYGQTLGGTGGSYFHEDSSLFGRYIFRSFRREHAVKELLVLNEQHNYWELRRSRRITESPRPFIFNAKKGIKE